MLLLDGLRIAKQLEPTYQEWHQAYRSRFGHEIRLGVIRIGQDVASAIYVDRKRKAAQRLGFLFDECLFSEAVHPEEVVSHIKGWNVHGMIVQLPLPPTHDRFTYLSSIPPEKDVDGLNPCGTLFTPCTPLGCLTLLKAYEIPLRGAHCVVVGRSKLVGRPLAELLLQQDATVTIVHSKTKNLSSLTLQADILCVCAGSPQLITLKDVRPGVVIVDIGIHRTASGLVGDVCPEVSLKAGALSPVPGGVGPMTVSSLLWNTLRAAFLAQQITIPEEPAPYLKML